MEAHMTFDDDYELCPDHGDTLSHADDQGDEYETREHLECSVAGCGYDAWVA
jgi:hypothetical protein